MEPPFLDWNTNRSAGQEGNVLCFATKEKGEIFVCRADLFSGSFLFHRRPLSRWNTAGGARSMKQEGIRPEWNTFRTLDVRHSTCQHLNGGGILKYFYGSGTIFFFFFFGTMLRRCNASIWNNVGRICGEYRE